MNKIMLALALPAAIFLASPGFAQKSETPKEEMKKKTDAQLKEELKALTKDISKGMKEVRKGLDEASMPRRKADELRAELDGMLEKLKKGEADEVHLGFKKYFEANPAKLAELLKLGKDEAIKLLENDEKLLKKLSENAEKTEELFKNLEFLEDVLKRQAKIEESMEKVKKAFEKGAKTESKIERVLDILQEAERRAKPGGAGKGQESTPQPGEQPGKEEGEGEGEGEGKGDKPPEEANGGKSEKGLEDSANGSASGKKPGELEEREPSGDVMKSNLQGKDAEKAVTKDAKKVHDPKYNGMKRAFDKVRSRLGK